MSTGYLYKTTHEPTGLMYFGSRKLKDGMRPETDEYKGSPRGSNRMVELFANRPETDFEKEVLTVGEYEDILELEKLLIEESWEKFGKESKGGKVCNLASGKAILMTPEILAKTRRTGSKQPKSFSKRIKEINIGKVRTAEMRERYSRTSSRNRAVINTATGEEYRSAAYASSCLGLSQKAVYMRIKLGTHGGVWKYKEVE